jgi:hypothetical protein
MRTTAFLLSATLLAAAGCGVEADPTEDSTDDTADGKADGVTAALWTAAGPTELRIEGSFTAAFEAAHAGQPDGIIPQVRVKDPFTAVLSYKNKAGRIVKFDAELQVRGNSSLAECDFPKLKVKVDKAKAKGTALEGANKFKIGTHCGEGGAGTIGRLRSEEATWRESLVYDIARAAGMPTLATKPVTITYVDTGTHTETKRKAFLLEHIDVAAARLGGTALQDPEMYAGKPKDHMKAADMARIQMLQALVGNWDWHLNVDGAEADGAILWNIEAVELSAGGAMIPIAADFDLSSFVTRNWVRASGLDVLPDVADAHVRQAAHYLVQEMATKLARADLLAARTYLKGKKAAIERAVTNAKIDATGRTNAKQHVAAFFTALDYLERALDEAQPQQ